MSLVSFSNGVFTIKVPTGTVTSGYGDLDAWHTKPHSGIDLYAPEHTPLYAPISGVVSKVHDYGNVGLGKAVFVRLDDGRQYVMGHLSEFKVHVGQVVHKGDLLAFSGNSGRSSNPHVHFGCFDKHGHFIDPDTFFESVKSSLAQWTNKLLVFNQEVETAFVDDPAIVSLDGKTDALFKLLDVVSDII